jgi:hypothetical protein
VHLYPDAHTKWAEQSGARLSEALWALLWCNLFPSGLLSTILTVETDVPGLLVAREACFATSPPMRHRLNDTVTPDQRMHKRRPQMHHNQRKEAQREQQKARRSMVLH